MTHEIEIQEVQDKLSTNVKDLVTMADLCQVTDSETAKQAIELVSAIKKTAKSIESERDSIVRPANAFVKKINETFKAISQPLSEAKKSVDGKIINFQREQAKIEAERRRLEAEKAAEEMRVEAERLREQNKEKQADLAVKAAESIQKVEIKEEVKSFKSKGMPTFKVRKITKFKVVDLKLLAANRPDLIIANESLIGQLARGGERNIAGVEIWEEEIAG